MPQDEKNKNQLTPQQKKAHKKAKQERRRNYMTVFMNGNQVRVKRPATIDGIPEDEWITQDADPIWLHQNGMWEILAEQEAETEDSLSPVVLDSEKQIPW
ncbi:hypothetical protein D5125_14500 [Magnetovirga frankeli]|uniref:hypothetical protein n=1 Tax=Magnetovirga frankeli TaxID=947516 RepID=UPI001293A9A8|nr:hypothetical protein D5125_14500 [gamma proteobacterium SS-5]